MADRPGTLELLARELSAALAPLEHQLAPGNAEAFLQELGIGVPAGLGGAAGALSAVAVKAAGVGTELTRLTAAIHDEDGARIVAEGIATVNALAQALTAIGALGPSLGGAIPAGPSGTNPEVAALPGRLVERVLADHVKARNPDLFAGLRLAGVIDEVSVPSVSGDPTRPPFVRRGLYVDRLLMLITDPGGYVRTTTGLGAPGFDGSLLWPRITSYLEDAGLPYALLTPPGQPPVLDAYLLRLAVAGTGLSARLRLPAAQDVSLAYRLGGPWSLKVDAKARFDAGLEATIQAPLQVTLTPPSGAISGQVTAGIEASKPGSTLLLLGQAQGSRLELTRFFASGGVGVSGSTSAPLTIEPTAQAALEGGHVVIDLDSGDGFVKTLTGGGKIESNFDLAAQWAPSKGLRLQGSAGLEIQIPAHVSVGPVDVTALFLRTAIAPGALPTEVSVSFAAHLGPLTAVVERIGAIVRIGLPPGGGGNLGPVDLSFAFKAPTGVGLAVDAGPVSGGGFLSIDPERGEYAGALELDFAGIVALRAIGLITTKKPDGSDGFSLVIVITAEFGTGIQLGFGFTLLAVGGVLGLNRSMALQPLMEGVRSNAIESVMFPRDVVANAQRIISDLRTFFPPHDGTFVIGPMAKLGWGTPTLVSLALGVIIEIPGNIAILGVLKVALPADDVAILKLQVNFAGAIEFDRKRVYFFAALYDSHILTMTIEGEMAVLAAFGDDATFVLSIGGFHPSFNPPPLPVPTPKRIAIDILNVPLERIRVEGYFAVTTNTVQFGARAELLYGVDDFGISGHLAFDALIQFSPFHFVVTISASVSVKVFGVGLFSVSLRLELSGPTPWRAQGWGSIEIPIFPDISVDFDITWGDDKDTSLPAIDVMPLLGAEYDKSESWRAQLPAGSSQGVSLRKIDPEAHELVLHPVGTLRVSQRAVPLDLTIQHVGSRKAADVKRVALTVKSGELTKRADLEESFAPAQFQDFDDAGRLAKPAYQKAHAGIEISAKGDDLRSSTTIKRVDRYEVVTIDTAGTRRRRFKSFGLVLFSQFLAGAAVAKSSLSQHQEELVKPFKEKIRIEADAYAVVSQADNGLVASFASEAMAQEHLAGRLASDPSLAGAMHVVPAYEAVA